MLTVLLFFSFEFSYLFGDFLLMFVFESSRILLPKKLAFVDLPLTLETSNELSLFDPEPIWIKFFLP
jgi:hypothetical protein